MDGNVLVAAQISSLFPSTHAISLVIPTKRADIPLSSPSDSEHATYSDLFHNEFTGTILLRLIHGGHILELVSLTTDAPPIRFIFPATVLPNPAIVWSGRDLHILAVTSSGSLFRIVTPIDEGAPVWQATTLVNIKTREYIINKMKGDLSSTLVHVQGIHCVVVSLPDGSILRLDSGPAIADTDDDEWQEYVLHHSSFLNSFTSFLHPSLPGASQIVSIASHPQPTDIGHIWTISRDRTLRLWTAAGGCVSEKTLAPTPTGRAVTLASGSTSNGSKLSVLLHSSPQRLLRVFTPSGLENPFVLAFIPTESSTLSGGFFQLFSTFGDHLQPIKVIECSSSSIHCHLQDFIVVSDTIHSLWDRQGQSVVHTVKVTLVESDETWHIAAYPPESELTPAYLDELLLAPGSLTDKFFKAIMRPGVFSSWTLHTAIHQYSDTCLTLPGPPPPQLLVSYASTGENIAAVVGCTVNLTRDPRTGAPQYDNYWNALKRDWEGFVARCREIERSARWPLAIGLGDLKGKVTIVERERIGFVVGEDVPLRLQRLLSQPIPVIIEPKYVLLDILWTLREKLGPRFMLSLETRLVDLAHQEIAFPYADIIQDQARIAFKDEIDEGLESWIIGRLSSVYNLENETRFVMDVIGGFDKQVKREEDEVELLLPHANVDLARALSASYATSTINARYDFSLLLITMLFFLTEQLSEWEPSLLGEIFVVFRGIAMLRSTSRQPAGTSGPQSLEVGIEDDVIAKMRNMNVASARIRHGPSYSLLHRLLTQFGSPADLPGAAHYLLDATGLLQSVSPAHASKLEVMFCERLRLLGHREATREALAWLPRTPGVTYVLLRVWLDEGRYEDAASVLENLAGSFGPDGALSFEDSEALAGVMPQAELFASEFEFYLHAAALFKSASVATYEVLFSQLALSCAPPNVNTADIWYTIMKGLTESGLYDDAYTAMMSSPYDKLRRDFTSHLVYRMCEDHAVDRLMALNFAGLSDEVEEALSFKARNADPRIRPFYSRILYTWYISRGDYRNAALTMYQRARKLAVLKRKKPERFIELAELQLEAYAVGINALSLVDHKSAWIVLPIGSESGNEPRKRRKLSRHIPEGKFALGKRDTEVVELPDIRYEYALLSAQVELIRKTPMLLASADLLLSPDAVVLKLAHLSRFDMALSTARSLNVDLSDIFAHLTTQCLRLARNPDAVSIEESSDWLLTDKVSSWSGTPADRGWRYLRQALERYDGPETNFAYSKIALETVLAFDRLSAPPPWLIQSLEDLHTEYLIRTCLRYEVFEWAMEHTLTMIRKDNARLASEGLRTAASSWLPYNLIDQVLLAAESQEDLSPQGHTLRQELQKEISNRVSHMQKLSQSPQ